MSEDLATWLRSQVDDDETLAESDYDIVISARKVRDAAAEITHLRTALATARREVEQERDEFFNRLGRITEYLNIPVDATAQRIIEAIQERIDNEREACASVEVRLTVPKGAETWTPLEAWEEALLAFDEAFRETIRAAAKEVKP